MQFSFKYERQNIVPAVKSVGTYKSVKLNRN